MHMRSSCTRAERAPRYIRGATGMSGRLAGLAVCAALAGLAPSGAFAASLYLTQGGSGSFNGAQFISDLSQSTGTGFLESFVRIQRAGNEQGYNTSGRPVPFDEKTDPNFTHDLQLGQVPIIGGFYEFLLDINEPNGAPNSLLSLDDVQIYTSPVPSQTTTNVASLGIKRYDMDFGASGEDNYIMLDHMFAEGSGKADMQALIPVSNFDGAEPTDYVYFYSRFGLQAGMETGSGAADGFEEWAVTPEPASATLALAGLCWFLGRRSDRAR